MIARCCQKDRLRFSSGRRKPLRSVVWWSQPYRENVCKCICRWGYPDMRCRREDLESIFVPLKCMLIFTITGLKREQNLTMLVGDMDLYLNLNQQFWIVCTSHFLFLPKLSLTYWYGWYEQNISVFPLSPTIVWWTGEGELWIKPWGCYVITNYLHSSGTKVF